MANFFDSLQDSFDMANAPRFVDFNALDEEEDRGNRSAWFDSHESFYADATILMSSPSKKMKKKKSAKVVSKAKAIPAEAQKAAPSRIRSTRSRSTALQPVTSLAEDTAQKKRKRAASVRPQLQGHLDENSNKEAILKGAANNENKENAPTVANSNICNTNVKSSPLPEAKQIDLDRIILERLEQNRRARRQASIASSATSSVATSDSAVVPSAPLHVESESESNPSSEPVAQGAPAQPLELPAVWHMDTVTAPCRPAQIVERDEKMKAKKKSSSSSSTRRDAGKQVPVGRVLQQQRANRLANEMAKQRERAKSQREQHRVRAETEATKRLQDQEKKEKEQMKTKDRAEQVEQLRKQREQEKQQRLREKEKREAEERQRKMSRFEEKLQHRKQLTLNEKQVLAEEFIVRSVKPLTFPKEFRFATEARSRSNKVKHEEEQALVKPTTTTAPRVRPSSRRGVRGSSRTQGLGGPTKPVSFVFSTEARAARKRPYAVPVEAPATTTNSRVKTAAATSKKRRRVDTEVAQQQ